MPKEPIIPPYDPYDPRQNELLTIQPSLKQPVMQLEQVQAYLHNVEEVLTHSKEYIRIRGAMNTLEYITSYNYYCLNPLAVETPYNLEHAYAKTNTATASVKPGRKKTKTKTKKLQIS